MDNFQIRISPEFEQIYISKFSKNYHFKRVGRDNAEWKKLDNLLNKEMIFKCFKHKNYEVVLIGHKSIVDGCVLYFRDYNKDSNLYDQERIYYAIQRGR